MVELSELREDRPRYLEEPEPSPSTESSSSPTSEQLEQQQQQQEQQLAAAELTAEETATLGEDVAALRQLVLLIGGLLILGMFAVLFRSRRV